jgi:hypothetical protein
MDGGITLVTPPDIYENNNLSILFMHLSDRDQDTVSQWLSQSDLKEDINIYVYNGEVNVSWLLYALGRCDYKYIDVDLANNVSQALMGYILGKNGICYHTEDENLAAIYSHINSNRTSSIKDFMERALSA